MSRLFFLIFDFNYSYFILFNILFNIYSINLCYQNKMNGLTNQLNSNAHFEALKSKIDYFLNQF